MTWDHLVNDIFHYRTVPGVERVLDKIFVQRRNEDFPGDPVVETLCFQCMGHGFDPWFWELRSILCEYSQKRKKKGMNELFIGELFGIRVREILYTNYCKYPAQIQGHQKGQMCFIFMQQDAPSENVLR